MPTVEKVDGQNIFFKFTADPSTGNVRTARNAGNLKKGGMSPDEFTAKWEGHPARDAFMNGFKAIQAGLDNLNAAELKEIFTPENPEGQRFINSEIIYTGNPNVINYNGNYIVLHNLQEFDPDGKLVDVQLSGGEFGHLVQLIDDAQQALDAEAWQIIGPQITKLQDLSNTDVLETLTSSLDALGVSDNQSLGDFVEEKLRTGPIGNLRIPVHKQEALIKRILGLGRNEDPEGLSDIASIKKGLTKEAQKKVSAVGTQTNAAKVIAAILAPVELIIHNLAVEVLRGLSSALTGGHDDEVSRLKADLESAKENIMAARDAKGDARREMLKKQLNKLGSSENISSSMEGIVFEHPPGSKALYKLTGAFAPLNQIIGASKRIPQGQNEALLRSYVRAFLVG